MSLPSRNPVISAVLFDMDGTLLRARMSEFIPRYVDSLADCCSAYVKPNKFVKAKLRAIRELIHQPGDGILTNEQRLFQLMTDDLNISAQVLKDSFDHFQDNGLDALQHFIRPIPLAQQIVIECYRKGIPLVLATNPVFPDFMIKARLRWGGLDENLFHLITAYENSYHCKPQPGYFVDIARDLGLQPQQCLMVGNDLNHDLAAVSVGMQAFLVDTWLVDHGPPEWDCPNRGDHRRLQEFLTSHLSRSY